MPARWRRRRAPADCESAGEDDRRGYRATPGHRPPGSLHDAGAGNHPRRPPRATVDRHAARLRKLGTHLRNSDWTSAENRAIDDMTLCPYTNAKTDRGSWYGATNSPWARPVKSRSFSANPG